MKRPMLAFFSMVALCGLLGCASTNPNPNLRRSASQQFATPTALTGRSAGAAGAASDDLRAESRGAIGGGSAIDPSSFETLRGSAASDPGSRDTQFAGPTPQIPIPMGRSGQPGLYE